MASLEADACTNYPDFAVIWSFIENFGDKLNVTLPNIGELQNLLENPEDDIALLIQIIAFLLRRIKKSITTDKWEKGLQKFAHSYSHEDGWELERSGFKKAKLEVKIRVLKNLFEKQFDLHKSFKEKINLLTAKQLRLQPCGRDKLGVSYWCQKDEFANLRIYKDDQDEETWSMVAKSREELVSLIERLQSQIPQKIKRETSVEESQSETTTPMILSRAPTPIDSTFHTPEASNLSSPVSESNLTSTLTETGTSSKIETIVASPAVRKVVISTEVEKDVPLPKTEIAPPLHIEPVDNSVKDIAGGFLTATVDTSPLKVNVAPLLLAGTVETLSENEMDTVSATVQMVASTEIEKILPSPETENIATSVKEMIDISSVKEMINISPVKEMVDISPTIKTALATSVKEMADNCLADTASPLMETTSPSVKGSADSSLPRDNIRSVNEFHSIKTESSLSPTNKEKDYKSRVKEKELLNDTNKMEDSDKRSERQPKEKNTKQQIKSIATSEKTPIIESNTEKQVLDRAKIKPGKISVSQKSKLEKIIDKFAAKTASDASRNIKGKLTMHFPHTEKSPMQFVKQDISNKHEDHIESLCPLKDIDTKIVTTSGSIDSSSNNLHSTRKDSIAKITENLCVDKSSEGNQNILKFSPPPKREELQKVSRKPSEENDTKKLEPILNEKDIKLTRNLNKETNESNNMPSVKQEGYISTEMNKATQISKKLKQKSDGDYQERKIVQKDIPSNDSVTYVKKKSSPVIEDKGSDDAVEKVVMSQDKEVIQKMNQTLTVNLPTTNVNLANQNENHFYMVDANLKKPIDIIARNEKKLVSDNVNFPSSKEKIVALKSDISTKILEPVSPLLVCLDIQKEETMKNIKTNRKNFSEKQNLEEDKTEIIVRKEVKLEEKVDKLLRKDEMKILVKKDILESRTKITEEKCVLETKAKEEKIIVECKEITKNTKCVGERTVIVESEKKHVIVECEETTKESKGKIDEKDIVQCEETTIDSKCVGESKGKIDEKDIAQCEETTKDSKCAGKIDEKDIVHCEEITKDSKCVGESKRKLDEKVIVQCEEITKDSKCAGKIDEKGIVQCEETTIDSKYAGKSKGKIDEKDLVQCEEITKDSKCIGENKGKIDEKVIVQCEEITKDSKCIGESKGKIDEKVIVQCEETTIDSKCVGESKGKIDEKVIVQYEETTIDSKCVGESKGKIDEKVIVQCEETTIDIKCVVECKGKIDEKDIVQCEETTIYSKYAGESKGKIDEKDIVQCEETTIDSKSVGESKGKINEKVIVQCEEITIDSKCVGESKGKIDEKVIVECLEKLEEKKCVVDSIANIDEKGIIACKDKMDENKSLIVQSKMKIETTEKTIQDKTEKKGTINSSMKIDENKDILKYTEKIEEKKVLIKSKETIQGKELESRSLNLKGNQMKDNVLSESQHLTCQGSEILQSGIVKGIDNSILNQENIEVVQNAECALGIKSNVEICTKSLYEGVKKNINETGKKEEIFSKINSPEGSNTELDRPEAVKEKSPTGVNLTESKDKLPSAEIVMHKINEFNKNSDASEDSKNLSADPKESGSENNINLAKQIDSVVEICKINIYKNGSNKNLDEGDDAMKSNSCMNDENVQVNLCLMKTDPERQINDCYKKSDLEKNKEMSPQNSSTDKPDLKIKNDPVPETHLDSKTVSQMCSDESPSEHIIDSSAKSCVRASSSKQKECVSGLNRKSAIVDIKGSVEDDTIEDPVLMVKGDGEGALCDSKNSYPFVEEKNWWENFEHNFGYPEKEIYEGVQYFWGEGSGQDCDAGNSGDEVESVNKNKMAAKAVQEVGKTCSDEGKTVNGVKHGEETENISLQTDEITRLNNKESSEPVVPEKRTRSSSKDCRNESEKSDDIHAIDQNCTDFQSKTSLEKDTQKNKDKNVNSKQHSKRKSEIRKTSDNEESEQSEHSEIERETRKTRARGRPKKTRSRRGSEKCYQENQSDDEIEDDYSSSKKSSNIHAKAPRQRSVRIAKIREREETERRELEAMRMKQLSAENKLKAIERKARDERRSMREIRKDKKEKKKDKSKKRKKKKKKGKVKPGNTDPWAHSSSSASSSSEEEEIMELEDEENEELVFKSDHEFSPESDIGEEDAQPIKRARTARKVKTEERHLKEEVAEKVEEGDTFDDTKCAKCDHQDHPETILLCDLCDAGWHLSCLRPPLLSVPEGDWTCPSCEHLALIEKLKDILQDFDLIKKRAENEELRRQRLAYINVSLDNVLPDKRKKRDYYDSDSETDSEDESGSDETDSESSSSSDVGSSDSGPLYTLRARPSRTSKEQVEDFDELIDEAIRGEMEAANEDKKRGKDIDSHIGQGNYIEDHPIASVGRGKDIANIMQGETEEDMGEEAREDVPVEEEAYQLEEEKQTINEVLETASEPTVQNAIPEVMDSEDKEPLSNKRKHVADEETDEESKDDESLLGKRNRSAMMAASKKRRRLTDLDAIEDEDDSDEDFKGSSVDDSDEEEESAALSSSFNTASDSDDGYHRSKGRGSRYDIQPLRRSSRNRRNLPSDYDSEPERMIRRGGSARKRRRDQTTSEDDDDELSSGSDSYGRNKPKRKCRPRHAVQKGRRGGRGKKKGGRKGMNKRKKPSQTEKSETKPRPRVRYSKPKVEETPEEIEGKRRVTRGRQINFCDTLFISEDEEEEEDEKPKSRGKVMKGERHQPDSSDYEESDDERKKRRGVSGGLGKGKVMKDEDDSDIEEMPNKMRIVPGRRPSAVINSEVVKPEHKEPSVPVQDSASGSPHLESLSIDASTNNTPPVSHGVESLIGDRPDPPNRQPRVDQRPRPAFESKIYQNPADRGSRFGGEPQIHVASSPVPAPLMPGSSVSITPVSYVPNPNAIQHGSNKMEQQTPLNLPRNSNKTIPNLVPSSTNTLKPTSDAQASVVIGKPPSVLQVNRNSPGPKWMPQMTSNPCGPSPRHSLSTPSRATMASNLNSSPPPPYRSSPIPPAHPSSYLHYQAPERFSGHPGFPPGYHPPRHPMGHAVYGQPGSHPGFPHHGGVHRGPPHEVLRHPAPNRRSPNQSTHPVVMKPGYPGLEPMPYRVSPSLMDTSGRHGSPGGTTGEESKGEGAHPAVEEKGEFSSGLMSYFSSQREDVD